MSYTPLNTFSLVTKTTTYTALVSDYFIKGDTTGGAFVITLFTAVGNAGKELVIKNLGTSNLTIDGNASETLDGSLTKVLTNKYASLNFVSDGANWQIF